MRIRRPWLTHILVLLVYALLALALTWPLAASFGSHVPGDGADDPPLTWNLWWIRYSLLDIGANPFDCDYLFYPIGINLAFYTLTILNGLLSIPLQGTLGLVAASNVLLLSSFVLGGYGTFLLVCHVLGRIRKPGGSGPDGAGRLPSGRGIVLVSAFAAGGIYAFSSSKLFYAALGQWNIASSQWVPFYILSLLRLGQQPERRRHAVLAAVFLLFQTYAEMTYASFLVLFTALWALGTLWALARRTRQAAASRPSTLRKLVPSLILLGALFAVGIAPLLAMMVPDMVAEGNVFSEGGGFAGEFSADLVGFAVPTMHHPLLGSLVEDLSFPYEVGQHLFLGYSVLFMALLGAICHWRSAQVRFWSASVLLFWLLTLGPSLRVNNQSTGLPLPFRLLAELPFFEGNRYPSRYSVMLTLSLAILAGFGCLALLRRALAPGGPARPGGLQPRFRLSSLLVVVLFGLVLFEHLSVPLPLSDMTVPPVYGAVAAEVATGETLLDIPVAWRNGSRVTGTEDTIIMFEQYYQSAHEAAILAGNTSRNPPFKFQYFTEAPVINTLIALETGHPVEAAIVDGDRALAPDVLRFFSIAAIVVHPTQAGPAVAQYVETAMPVEQIFADAATLAYSVQLQPWPSVWSVEPGSALGRLSFAEGWGAPSGGIVWAQRRAARLFVPANGQDQIMTFRALAPGEGQHLSIVLNGRQIGPVELQAGWGTYQIHLPAGPVTQGLNELWLRFGSLYDPGQAEVAARTIGATGVAAPVNLVVQSAGYEVGDLARIYVNGRDVSLNGRGYNLAVIDPNSGKVLETACFDTHADAEASGALASTVDRVAPGMIVAAAAADEASMSLGQQAVEALRQIGASGDLRDRFRWGHAIVGVKGAAPGSAMEAMDWMRPVTLVVGEGLTEPAAAAAFSSIALSAAAPQP